MILLQQDFASGLIDLCAPTLAGIKVGSIFLYRLRLGEDIHQLVAFWDDKLREKGLRIAVINERTDGGLVYVFRPEMLATVLQCSDINCFLDKYGFAECCSVDKCVNKLKCRFCEEKIFPHEIGIFLGYPLEDVRGFIENKGRDFSLCGPWKVYGDRTIAERMFERYAKCAQIYRKRFASGADVLQLTVAT